MPFPLVTRKLCLAVFAAIAAASGPALAREAFVFNIEREAQSGDMTVSVHAAGCISSSVPYLGNNISVSVGETTASIHIDGKFEFGPSPLIQTSDCNSRLRETFTFEKISPRRYRILNNGDYAGVKDFSLTIEEQNINARRHSALTASEAISIAATGFATGDLSKHPLPRLIYYR